MTTIFCGRGAAAALAAAVPFGVLSPACADVKDYAFELIQPQTKMGHAVVAVRLVDTRSGKPVPDVVIFASRIDMAPGGMPTMAAPLEAMPSTQPGEYRFRTDLAMEGSWRLSLAGKVQGETGTVKGTLDLKVKP